MYSKQKHEQSTTASNVKEKQRKLKWEVKHSYFQDLFKLFVQSIKKNQSEMHHQGNNGKWCGDVMRFKFAFTSW